MIYVVLPVAGRVGPTTLFFVSDRANYILNTTCKKGFKSGLRIRSPTYVRHEKPCTTEVWINFGGDHCPFEVRSRSSFGGESDIRRIEINFLSNRYLVFYVIYSWVHTLSYEAPKCDERCVQCENENIMLQREILLAAHLLYLRLHLSSNIFVTDK